MYLIKMTLKLKSPTAEGQPHQQPNSQQPQQQPNNNSQTPTQGTMATSNPTTPFHDALHAAYITSLGDKLDSPTSYEGAVTEHLRMSGVYWSLAALSLLRTSEEVDTVMGLTRRRHDDERSAIVDWVFTCYDSKSGGFGGNCSGGEGSRFPHDAHLLYTLSALQIIAMADCLEDERLDKDAIVKFVSSLQNDDGSFSGDKWGEIDTRFTYCAFSCLALLGRLPLPDWAGSQDSTDNNDPNKETIDIHKAVRYIMSCRNNFDGGFGAVPGAESHAGQVFCCIGALSISHSLDLLNEDTECNADVLSWWLAERQCDSGGLNGRPEKQADVCYSWWILSALSILGRVNWIDASKLGQFILNCQDEDDGGIADRPYDMPDVYHTFFGLCGLSLIGHLDEIGKRNSQSYRKIDPVFALPSDVVRRVGLTAQVVCPSEGKLDSRLTIHSVLSSS
jgi:geranylgeranyl transferase type-2 subunit beta